MIIFCDQSDACINFLVVFMEQGISGVVQYNGFLHWMKSPGTVYWIDSNRLLQSEDFDSFCSDVEPPSEDFDSFSSDVEPQKEDFEPFCSGAEPPSEDFDSFNSDVEPPSEDFDSFCSDAEPQKEDFDSFSIDIDSKREGYDSFCFDLVPSNTNFLLGGAKCLNDFLRDINLRICAQNKNGYSKFAPCLNLLEVSVF